MSIFIGKIRVFWGVWGRVYQGVSDVYKPGISGVSVPI